MHTYSRSIFSEYFLAIPEAHRYYAEPGIYIVAGIIIGWILERVFLPLLHSITAKTYWKFDEVIANACAGLFFWLFLLLGLYEALLSFGPQERLFEYADVFWSAMLTVLGTILSVRIAIGMVRLYADKSGSVASTSLIEVVIRVSIISVGTLVGLQTLGIAVAPILTALGVLGLAASLALKDTLENLFSGIQVVSTRMIRPGDYIRIDNNVEGRVIDVNWRNTTLQTILDTTIIIPNSKIAHVPITNFQLPSPDWYLGVTVHIDYKTDLEAAEALILGVAKKLAANHPGCCPDTPPLIRYAEFDPHGIECRIFLRIDEYIQLFGIRHDLIKQLHQAFKENNIVIPLPQIVLNVPENMRSLPIIMEKVTAASN